MIFGFNTDVHGQDGVYHVQTEDRGHKNPVIESIIYVGGKILGKKRTTYDPASLSQQQIEECVRQQHKELTEAIRNGNWNPAPQPHGAGEDLHAAPYSINLVNGTDFRQGEYLRFAVAVSGGNRQPAGDVALEIRWIVDGMISDRQSLSSRSDGGAEVWVSAPLSSQQAALLLRAHGPNGTAYAKFAVVQAE